MTGLLGQALQQPGSAPSTAAPVAPMVSNTDTPTSTAGLIVFVAVVAIIVVGALVLYLRHRPRGGPSHPAN